MTLPRRASHALVILLLGVSSASAQPYTATISNQYVISTIAGGAPPPTPTGGTSASIGGPARVATNASGNIYFTSLNSVFKVDQTGTLTRVAGTSRGAYSGDGGSAMSAQLNFFSNDYASADVALDGAGNLYIADPGNNLIRKILPSGIVTTVAGAGYFGFATADRSGDGGPAVSAPIAGPAGVAVDGSGNIFIADHYDSRIRKVSPSGIITTVAGSGGGFQCIGFCTSGSGFSGDGGSATSAQLSGPAGIALDSAGNLYIADQYNNRIRKVSPQGIIITVAGNGTGSPNGGSFSGDGGSATSAGLWSPTSVAVDAAGNLYIADTTNQRIRKVSNGVITTVAGGGAGTFSGDGGPATSASLYFPTGVAVDGAGNLYIADSYNNRIRKVSSAGIITTVVGNGTGALYTGTFFGDGSPATSAGLNNPQGVAVDSSGIPYIADTQNNRVRRISPNGVISTVAGNGSPGFSGDGASATGAQLNTPTGVATDNAGNLYIADCNNNRVRKVSPGGNISTVAGSSSQGFSGDNGPATSAQLSGACGVAVDSANNLYIADSGNNRVRKVTPNGTITTVAGFGTAPGNSGDGGPATSAVLRGPRGVAVDSSGNIFIDDRGNCSVRVVAASSGVISTVLGYGLIQIGNHGAGNPCPSGIAVDRQGNLFVDYGNFQFILEVTPKGDMLAVSGGLRSCSTTNCSYYSGDGGPANNAELYGASGLAVDAVGNVYIADSGNSAIRMLQPTNQTVLISAVVDAASEMVGPISPGKIVTLYGAGLGPSFGTQFQISNGSIGTQLGGTTVSFNGIAAPIIYTSSTQVSAIVPYGVSGANAQVTVSYQGQSSTAVTVPLAASAPSLFSLNQTGAGQVAAINAIDGSVNTAANPVKIGSFISLYATGEGQTTPAGVDGKIASGSVLPAPNLKVSVTVGGIPAVVQYAGAAPSEVAGVMQVNVQIPAGVQPGGYVPVVLQVGNAATTAGALWIAVAGN